MIRDELFKTGLTKIAPYFTVRLQIFGCVNPSPYNVEVV
jgi:hypothetical protein